MIRILTILGLLAVLVAVAGVDTASAQGIFRGRVAKPWHGDHYNTAWGAPVVLVVPPTVNSQTQWGWGVGNTRVVPIRPQFTRRWPGPEQYGRSQFRPTPRWPSDTNQFGSYYIRGPW